MNEIVQIWTMAPVQKGTRGQDLLSKLWFIIYNNVIRGYDVYLVIF